MNKDRRKQINEAITLLQGIAEQIASARELVRNEAEGEQEYFDNMPEGLQASDRGQNADNAASLLNDVADELENFNVDDLIEKLEEAKG